VGDAVALPDELGPGGAAVAALLPISAAAVIALTVANARISVRGWAEVMTSSKAERRRFSTRDA
jgi:hypothetical protein